MQRRLHAALALSFTIPLREVALTISHILLSARADLGQGPKPPGGYLVATYSKQCKAVTKAGGPCRARPVIGTQYCVAHTNDPDVRARAIEGSRRGGQRHGERRRRDMVPPIQVSDLDLKTATGLLTYLARALRRLAELPFDVRVANAMAQTANVARAAIELAEIEERLVALETKRSSRVT